MQKTYIGCSGFYYKEWKNIFYPEGTPQSKWFRFYTTQFNTLELNVTFYRFPTEKSLSKWYNDSPDDFMFSVKAPKAITHFKKFNDCEQMLASFYTTIQNSLAQKLGCVLFQLPPQLIYSEELLQKIIDNLNPSFKNVIEFRHVSWWNEIVFRKLETNHIIFCGESYPKLPETVIKTTENIYYRFHGVPVLYKSLYSKEFLDNIINEIKTKNPKESWIYFNNTWGTSAIENGKYVQQII